MPLPPELRTAFVSHDAQFCEAGGDYVTSFGDSCSEFEATETGAAVTVLPELVRLCLTGKDRAKFLHNFCTNEVKGLATGQVVEAFLTNVKARILGHGYIAAFEDRLELWMLGGDVEAVVAHLTKYVIVEDVDVQVVESCLSLAVAGPKALEISQASGLTAAEEFNNSSDTSSTSSLTVQWNAHPLLLISVPMDTAAVVWQKLVDSGAKPAGQVAFDALRISERFPFIGTDLSESNMAPEADRNQQAISYTKGCYLGQEPIARLDAMGHVNRQLCRGLLSPIECDSSEAKRPVITSVARLGEDQILALSVISAKAVSDGSPVVCSDTDGNCYNFRILR